MSESPTERPSIWKRALPDLIAAGGFLVLSSVYAWRVVLNFGSHLAGHGGDSYMNLWNMWWFKTALASGQNPYFTDMVHQPTGSTLLFHTLNASNCVLALPFDALFGQPVAYNIIFLFSFAASGFTMYLLVRELTGQRLAAFLAGCVFTFSHYHFAHAQGHLNLTSMEWFPLFLLGLVRAWRRRRLRDGVLLGVALALITFTDTYYTVYALLTAGLAFLVQLIRNPGQVVARPVLKAFGLGAGIYLATGGILLVSMVVTYARTEFVKAHDPFWYSADLQGFFVPGWISAWSGSFEGIWSRWTGNTGENCWYLGYSVLALGVLAFALKPSGHRPWRWAGLGLLGLLLALGPAFHWGGGITRWVPMPFRLFEAILPVVKMSGVPGRWHFLALVASSVLAGMGAAALVSRLRDRRLWRLPAGWVVVSALTGLVLLELAPRWVESRPLVQAGFVERLGQEPADRIVFDLGDWNQMMYRQIGHGHRMIGGWIARPTQAADDFWLRSPFTQTIRGHNRLTKQEVITKAEKLRLKYLIVPDHHKPQPDPQRFGCRPLWREGHLTVWELPWGGESATWRAEGGSQ